ncbi:salicylate hydroxylase [Hypoxylon sp. NC1633]|nr:salicylate hydroxylase [Hypoxylon sp. NC1633]
MDSRIRLAIIGGGIAGATLANALTKHPHLEIHIYESAPQFTERGAAISFGVNAISALQQAIPSAKALLEEAGAVPMNAARAVIGSGPFAGTLVRESGGSDGKLAVHRASLLQGLLARLPGGMLHASKRLTAINRKGGEAEAAEAAEAEADKIELVFQDGDVAEFDAVIGADGIFSFVREHVLQGTAADHVATPAGFWDCRNLVAIERARAALGAQYFVADKPMQYAWLGDGAFLMHDVIEYGTTVQCVISGVEKDTSDYSRENREKPLTREYLEEQLRNWAGGPITEGMIELILDQPKTKIYSQWEHKSTPTYANGRLCIVGDAAHASTPWQGAGAGQAIEDAVVLGALLGNISSPSEINIAFKAFNTVRRPRCQRVIESSSETGLITCGQSSAGLDLEKLKEALAPRWQFLYDFSLDAHTQDALNEMQRLRI